MSTTENRPVAVVVFPLTAKHLRVAVCPYCWWGIGEGAPQNVVQAAAKHSPECTGRTPAWISQERVALHRRWYRQYVGPLPVRS